MKFLKVENKILNVEQIKTVTENSVTVGYLSDGDLPFGDPVKETRGIRVQMIDSAEFEQFIFESETIESFYEKLVAA
ncbi:hypothetical protein [Acinetobacter lwoffii]|uniref:hypothetical protein n=1 Tax=Acinetobacter lwoffii TaxID=28090 RepID=UPI0002CE8CC1|nr:hypothetical protein [Acinetobacter lwoffii]ENW29412.1 hypothetical protein F924_00977 [Acinetobacter lwoffii ATCC 9957 = CIP 70.31]